MQRHRQVEMGLYGAIIVLPNAVPAACTSGLAAANRAVEINFGETDYRLSAAAYDHVKSCYDREYLFQFSEMDPSFIARHKCKLRQRRDVWLELPHAVSTTRPSLTILPIS